MTGCKHGIEAILDIRHPTWKNALMNKPARTIQIPAHLEAELRLRAEANGIELGQLIEVALAHYLDDIDDLAEDERRWAQYEQDGKSIPGDAIKSWIESWGTANEKPTPKP